MERETARPIDIAMNFWIRFSLEANGFFKTRYKSNIVADYRKSEM